MNLLNKICNKITHGMEDGVEWWIHTDVDKVEIDAYSTKGSERFVYTLMYPKGIFGKMNKTDVYRIEQITNNLIQKYKCDID